MAELLSAEAGCVQLALMPAGDADHSPLPASVAVASISADAALFKANVTSIYWHPACAKHCIPDHIEQPQRVEYILKALRSQLGSSVLFREACLAPMDLARLFHTEEMIDKFTHLWKDTQEAMLKKNKLIFRSIDGDTQIMHTTREAALRAIGAITLALDHMFLPTANSLHVDTAFCCIRPPGHHAETQHACGFCFFNNCAIGAKYAQQRHKVKKVAILDFDVHHGNGSEEGFEYDESVFYGSTHEYGNFPGTGKDPFPKVGALAMSEKDRRIVNRYLHSGPDSREEFRVKWLEILQEMERFAPELVIISAGFDAHDDDPLSDIELQDEDYRWITEQILLSALRISVAVPHASPVKVLSALEGGYDLDAIARSAVLHVEALRDGFAGVQKLYEMSVVNAVSAKTTEALEETAEAPFGGDEVAAIAAELQAMAILSASK